MCPWRVALAAIVFGLSIAANSAAEEGKFISLFNTKDLTGWKAVLADEKAKAEDVWTVTRGVLYCKGEPRGYLRTERDDFENYVLKLQWRFPPGTKGGNSGVLVHTSTPGAIGIWPKSLEAQLNHLNAGDIWVIGETCQIENAAERVKGRRHLNLTDDSEKPTGEWNQYEITCQGDDIKIKVNGVLVNHVTKCSATKGAICLQSEGAPIEFREITLQPIKR
jgi:3-keto-disaccharide hydrolase